MPATAPPSTPQETHRHRWRSDQSGRRLPAPGAVSRRRSRPQARSHLGRGARWAQRLDDYPAASAAAARATPDDQEPGRSCAAADRLVSAAGGGRIRSHRSTGSRPVPGGGGQRGVCGQRDPEHLGPAAVWSKTAFLFGSIGVDAEPRRLFMLVSAVTLVHCSCATGGVHPIAMPWRLRLVRRSPAHGRAVHGQPASRVPVAAQARAAPASPPPRCAARRCAGRPGSSRSLRSRSSTPCQPPPWCR